MSELPKWNCPPFREIKGFDFTVLPECSAKDNLALQCQEKMGLDQISRKFTSFLDALILSAMPPRLSQWPRSFVWLRAFKGKLLELSFEKNVCLLVELKPKKARIEVWRKQKKVFFCKIPIFDIKNFLSFTSFIKRELDSSFFRSIEWGCLVLAGVLSYFCPHRVLIQVYKSYKWRNKAFWVRWRLYAKASIYQAK